MTPDIEDLRTLSAIARTGSIGAAARALGVSQPAVSARLRRLEAKLGVVLLERGARGSALTPSGNRLLGYAERAVAIADEAASVVGRLGSGPRLAIGAHASVATAIAPTLAAASDELGLDLELIDQHTPELLRLVSDGVLRAAVVNGSALMPGLVGHDLWDVPVIAVVAAAHPLARRRSVRTADAARWPIAVTTGAAADGTVRALRGDRRTMRLRHVNLAGAALQLATDDEHVAFVPQLAAAASLAQGTLVPLTVRGLPPWLERHSLVHRSEPADTAVLERIVRLLRDLWPPV